MTSSPEQECLLGFDARELWMDVDHWWTPERRDRFLLRPVAKPLSTDVLVWPSVLGDDLPLPSWRGANQGLWDDLARIREHLAKLGPAVRAPHQLIAVSWHAKDGFVPGPYGPYPEPTSPSERSPGWNILGFDVSDGALLSGLSNCGYTDEERDEHRAKWGPHLNEHHLFDDMGHAFEFQRACEQRVAEHAPFFVFGLWSIEVVGAPGS